MVDILLPHLQNLLQPQGEFYNLISIGLAFLPFYVMSDETLNTLKKFFFFFGNAAVNSFVE